jgi:hypothetical protein
VYPAAPPGAVAASLMEHVPCLIGALADIIAAYTELHPEQLIKALHPAYADIVMTSTHTDRHGGTSFSVAGPGSTFCLNKGDYHTTSLIYFHMPLHGDLSQLCCSASSTVRTHGGVMCGNFRSAKKFKPVL